MYSRDTTGCPLAGTFGHVDTQIFGARKVSGMLVKGVSVCVIARRLHASYD